MITVTILNPFIAMTPNLYCYTHNDSDRDNSNYKDNTSVEWSKKNISLLVVMYPDAWAFSINYKSADRSTFAMYWGTFVMYPSFWKWH